MTIKLEKNYKWSTNVSPLIGIPMFDKSDHPLGMPAPLQPRSSFTSQLVKVYQNINDNFSQYYESLLIKNNSKDKVDAFLSYIDIYNNYLYSDNLFEDDLTSKMVEIDTKFSTHCSYIQDNLNIWGLELYDSQYKTIARPFISDHITTNSLFAFQRLAGNNPIAIKRVSFIPANFPLTDGQYKLVMGEDDSLSEALNEKRVYMLDYSYLKGAESEDGYTKPEGEYGSPMTVGYSYLAMALFAVSKETKELMPIGIQCGQDNQNNPIILATDTETDKRYWAWQRAKYVINTADESEFQLSTHLGLTHLLIEAFAMATYRMLPENHPIINY